ncbi:uncharacterized protein F5Z01DRAFT_635709 [Emericellopsis atlantica]|uniref:Zn(2)-C6 fungal-type domain-containing protein n=1 Tax=Emericellopsis atlantica TaxID=2614577 RepID=A0A9P7ZPH4_9HYPO|nr:uncharacterized protein F5Z01DRAFT_635709 [Emericellopsis atlantica]KAG9255437.1 hypothetical protein F5Z01DRAFT_635709 [Emericellopsis atlantica]
MFATFRNGAPPSLGAHQAPLVKPKRAQVSRACEACRAARTKCDQGRPCQPCQKYGKACVVTARKPRSAQKAKPPSASPPTSRSTTIVSTSNSSEQLSPEYAARAIASQPELKVAVDGQLCGSLSLEFFIHRLSQHLNRDTRLPPPPISLLDPHDPMNSTDGTSSTKAQQDRFLDLFWPTYHVSFPALDEASFRSLYTSLWHDSETRRADPLVDVVTALTIQYAYSYLGLGSPRPSTQPDAEVCTAGSAFYHRCQTALQRDMEMPSMKSVQCMFYSAVYLSFARCYNAAHTTIKTAGQLLCDIAVRNVQDAEVAYRLQACIRIQDIRLSMRLGRPLAPSTLALPCLTEDPRPPSSEADWTLYYKSLLALSETASTVYTTLADLLTTNAALYHDSTTRNHLATLLTPHLAPLQTAWPKSVPLILHVPRATPSAPFTTSLTPLDLSSSVPIWLMRQRLALEAHYHALCLSPLRTLISYTPTPSTPSMAAESLCDASVAHAVALTHLIHQGMIHTDIFTGCYQAFEWQMDAVYAMAAFASAYPLCPSALRAREGLRLAGEMFVRYGAGNGAAKRMGKLTEDLERQVGDIVDGFTAGMQITPPQSERSGVADTPWDGSVLSQGSPWATGSTPVDPELLSSWAEEFELAAVGV